MSTPGLEASQLDLRTVRAAFDRASRGYEAAALLQAKVADELLSRLKPFGFAPAVVLDLGAGPGRSAARLKRLYRRALVVALDLSPGMLRQALRHQRLLRRFERVCADADRLPLASGSIDVVFSSLMLQWCQPIEGALAETRRVLRPGGFFAFSTFGPDTLKELRAAWAEADELSHVNRFLDVHDIGDALVRAQFTEPVLDVERVQMTYADGLALMRDLKAIGARNATAGRPRALLGRAHLERVLQAYEGFRRDGRLPATFEVIYGAAWASRAATSDRAGTRGPSASPPGTAGGTASEARIAPSDIRRKGPHP
jgi:malonyl-CoA O-methyltransferase